MLTVDFFWRELNRGGFSFFSGVPCSILKPVLNNLPQDTLYISAVREDSALGVCSGAFLAGKSSALLIQNSGLGNIINALTSFNLIYKIPVLLIITWRGEPEKLDAPEHKVMGKAMLSILDVLAIPYKIIDETFSEEIDWAKKEMNLKEIPVALILREGVVK